MPMSVKIRLYRAIIISIIIIIAIKKSGKGQGFVKRKTVLTML